MVRLCDLVLLVTRLRGKKVINWVLGDLYFFLVALREGFLAHESNGESSI